MTATTDCLFITSSKARAVQFSVYPYLGVGYLSSFLKMKELSCQLYDVDVKKGGVSKIIKTIAAVKPLIVGYSVMSISLPLFYKLTLEIRKRFPEIIIVAGGPHITNDPQIVFDMGIDYGFRGHSEISFPQFVERVKANAAGFDDIEGIVINKTKLIREPVGFNASSSEILPDYQLYEPGKYQNVFYGRRWFTLITTNGCAYNCKFCKDPGKNKYAEYPMHQVLRQIEILVNDYKVEWLSFVDDSFTYNRDRVIEICNHIIQRGWKFKWTCCTRVDVLDAELIQIMKKAGLYYVILGVEAGNEEVRKRINKNISTARYVQVIDELRNAGIKVLCSYVLGNPGESYAQINETIKLSLNLKANYAQYYNMTALPQSPIFQYGLDEGVFKQNAWTTYMRGETRIPHYVPNGLSLARLKRLRTQAFLKYYLRPKNLWDMGIRIFTLFWDLRLGRGS